MPPAISGARRVDRTALLGAKEITCQSQTNHNATNQATGAVLGARVRWAIPVFRAKPGLTSETTAGHAGLVEGARSFVVAHIGTPVPKHYVHSSLNRQRPGARA